MRKRRRCAAADNRRGLVDEFVILEDRHHKESKVHATRHVAFENEIADVPAPHRQVLALLEIAPAHDGPPRVACKHSSARVDLVIEVHDASEARLGVRRFRRARRAAAARTTASASDGPANPPAACAGLPFRDARKERSRLQWVLPGAKGWTASLTEVTAVTQHFQPDVYPRVDDEATFPVEYPKAQGIIQASWYAARVNRTRCPRSRTTSS
jgi:hypothetical protein